MERVIFRKWGEANGGGIIAVLPDVDANPGKEMMYESIGQHGEGDYYGILSITKVATNSEYSDLLTELTSIGYELRVVKRLIR